MAVETISRIRIIAHSSLSEELLDVLQSIGTVHVERLSEEEALPGRELEEEEIAAIRRHNFSISQAEFLLSFFREYGFIKDSFLKTLVKEKHSMTLEAFRRAEERIDLELVYNECSEFDRRLASVAEEKSRLEQEKEQLLEWTALEIDLDQLQAEHPYGIIPVRLPVAGIGDIVSDLAEQVPYSHLDIVAENGSQASCLILYYGPSRPDVEAVLSSHRYEQVTLPAWPLEPAERLEQVEREVASLERRRERLLDAARAYAGKRREIEILREYLVNERHKLEATARLGRTRSTVVMEGWVAESGVERTLEALGAFADELEVELSEPAPEDSPPVSLKNGRWSRPFELLTRLYGVPSRSEYDPTPLIAISFVVFAGFCIGDVGYGLVLVAVFLGMRKYLPVGGNVKDLLLILAYAGLFAMVFGVLSGSWFAIDPEKLPSFMRNMAVLDMLREPLPVMGVAMGLGLAHMLAGTVVEFRDNVREGRLLAALIDQGLVFLFFAGLGVAVPLLITKALPSWAAVGLAGLPVLLMLLLLGRESKSIPGKAVNGLYETYNTVVGWMGDVISYVRLYALGLATFVIGWVVNTLAGMVMGIGPVIGIVMTLLLIVIGHTFNVTINLLGAFVHPLRLEYVEFFGKFYEDGGRRFEPLKIESKTVLIEEEGA